MKSPIEITRSQAMRSRPSTCQLSELGPDVRQHTLRERLIARTFLIDKAPGKISRVVINIDEDSERCMHREDTEDEDEAEG